MSRREFYKSELFLTTIEQQKARISHVAAFAVSGIYTYVRDKELTTAELRGSRPAQLIEQLGAANQVAKKLLLTGQL